MYQNNSSEIEICGMVSPPRRRQGIFTGLLAAALPEIARRGSPETLLVVDRACPAGVAFAQARSGVLKHSEYRMSQAVAPPITSGLRDVSLRAAVPADFEFLADCLERAFGRPMSDGSDGTLSQETTNRLKLHTVIEEGGAPVGTMLVDRLDESAGIYGFAVLPELQGKGIGRAALTRVSHELRSAGVESVHLEVLVDNPGALHLYESCGFVPEGVEDY
ncbi:MAG TPA: GNAT family N-acetyltransferase, partial [Acidimicrobiales bacterium]|nr:GNAT family N-acetyltransferase [Acidimicrobiales bacterium]